MAFQIKSPDIYDYLFCLMVIVLPYSLKAPNVIAIVLSLFFIADFKKFIKIDFGRLKKWTFIILGVLVLYWLAKGILTNTLHETKYGLLAPLALLPVLFMKIRKKHRVMFAMVLSGLIYAIRAIYGMAKYYAANHTFSLFEGGDINTVLGQERPYIGFFSIIAIFIAATLAFRYARYRYWLAGYILFMTVFVFFISARISIITLLLSTVIYLLFYLKLSWQRKMIYFGVSALVVCMLVFSIKSLRERMFITGDLQKSLAGIQRYEPRVIIWDCAYQIATSTGFESVFGLDSEEQLNALFATCYDQKLTNKHRANFFITTKLNSHNQFIGTYLTSGAVGLGLLLAFFACLFSDSRKNFIKISLVLALFLFFIVENVLRRQLGIYYLALVISLVQFCPLHFGNQKSKPAIKN